MKKLMALLVAVAMVATMGTAVSGEEWIELDLSNQGITNERLAEMIASGEIPKKVAILDLGYNQISDISPLAELEITWAIDLYNNQISDLTPLAGLTNLKYLFASYNQISDLTPITGLTNLTNLGLEANQITDLTPLKEMTQLKGLGLRDTPISISQLEELKAALPDCEVFYDWCGRCETLSCVCNPTITPPTCYVCGYDIVMCDECWVHTCVECNSCNCDINPDTSVTFAILPVILAGGIAAICRPRFGGTLNLTKNSTNHKRVKRIKD